MVSVKESMKLVEAKLSPMQKFYYDRTVFITGATGFLGQVIIEKLLRSCNVKSIYVLIRPKRDESIQKRLTKILNGSLFDVVRAADSTFCDKIIPILGDCTLPTLGVTEDDRKTLIENVNFVFHSAATVRFNEKLKTAFKINVIGTYEVLNLAKDIINLKAFVHVSTAYAFGDSFYIEEKVYPLEKEYKLIFKNRDMYSDKEWDNLEQKTLETWPNTYIYTKTMTENYVHASGKNLPISIFRPAIIGSIYQNPASGWIDKPFGPVGLGLSLACGLLGVMFLNGNNRMEVVPVDLCVNSLLQSAHDVAQKSLQEPLVFNFTTFKGNTISNQKFIDYILLHLKQYPFTKSVWYSRITLTMNPYIYTILNFLNHKIPCCMIDLWMIMSGQKPRFLRKFEKLSELSECYRYFTNTKFDFDNNNVKRLYARLDDKDKEIFFSDMESIDWMSYVKNTVIGARLYMMNDVPESIPAAKKRYQKLKVLHYTVVSLFIFCLIYLIYKVFSMIF